MKKENYLLRASPHHKLTLLLPLTSPEPASLGIATNETMCTRHFHRVASSRPACGARGSRGGPKQRGRGLPRGAPTRGTRRDDGLRGGSSTKRSATARGGRHMLPPRQLQPGGSPWLGGRGSPDPPAPAAPPGPSSPVQGGSDDARDWRLRRILQRQRRQRRRKQTMEE